MKPRVRDLSLYVHIPFCKAKCAYCDFLSFGGCDYRMQKQYVDALCKEISAYKTIAEDYRIKTVFLGGGTPSYVDGSLIQQIMRVVHSVFAVDEQAEVTIEGNPDSLTKDKLLQYREIGINRLSIGLQSTNDEMLRRIGRIHNYDQFVAAYSNARQAGFDNINVDLMSGLPGDSLDSYITTLAKVVRLQPEHISAYSLIVEDGTPLSENEELLSMLPSEEMERKLYAKTKLLLKNSGYDRYEISNYSQKGYECRHNLVYWTGGEYLGVGLGAASYLTVWMNDEQHEKVRFHGVENLDEYIGRFSKCDGMKEDDYTNTYHFYENGADVFEEMDGMYTEMYGFSDATLGMNISSGEESSNIERYRKYENNAMLEFIRDYYRDLQFIKRKDEMEEFMFLGLRLIRGISRNEFYNKFSISLDSIYGKIVNKYISCGLLEENKGRIALTDKGIDVSNMVLAEFML